MKTFMKIFLMVAFAWLAMPAARAALTVSQFSCGYDSTFFVLSDGSLWATGLNNNGGMGLGFTETDYYSPVLIVSNGVTSVSAGTDCAMFTKSDGSLWAMGYNNFGSLGDGSFNGHYFPEMIISSGVTRASLSYYSALIQTVRVTGTFPNQTITVGVSSTGLNASGQLGNGTTNNVASPTTIDSEAFHFYPTTYGFATGYHDSYYIRPDGSLWGMGANAHGELGVNNTNTYTSQVMIASNVTAVAAGLDSAMFLKTDGSLWAMGANQYGQLGDNSTNDRHFAEQIAVNVTAIAVGQRLSMFIKSDGSLWGMGYSDGQLGSFGNYYVPTKVVASNVVAISVGSDNCMYQTSDGKVWAAGSSEEGLAGDGYGDGYLRYIPEQIFPSPPPQITSFRKVSSTNLYISGSYPLGGNYALLSSSNLATPLTNWTPMLFNTVTDFFSASKPFIITNAYTNARQFYILQKLQPAGTFP